MTTQLSYSVQTSTSPVPMQRREEILAGAGFGRYFTDHMVTATWTPERGWHDGVLRPYGPFELHPAAAVLHFGQEIFEGLKAYRTNDGSIALFRPDANAERFRRSARRLALPELDPVDFVSALDLLVSMDRDWVPAGEGRSLYLRPFMFASEPFLHVRTARHVTFAVIATPAASYFSTSTGTGTSTDAGVRPVSIWISDSYTRASAGGTGAAKTGGNYAASLLAQREAAEHGCEQVVFLDAAERRWAEEIGNMNPFVVFADGRILTPALNGTILSGVTRDSVLSLARDLGHQTAECPLDVDEWRDGVATGRIREVFATGTAAVVTPIGRLAWRGGALTVGDGEMGPVTASLRERLLDLQYGRVADTRGWLHRVR